MVTYKSDSETIKNMDSLLKRHKEIASLMVKAQFYRFIVTFPFSILFFYCADGFVAHIKIYSYFLAAGILMGIISFFFLFAFFYCIRFRLMFNKIAFINEDSNEFICENFHLLSFSRPISGGYAIIVYIDTNNKKYYGFSYSGIPHSFKFKNFLKEKMVGKKLTIKHYAGTNLLIEMPITLYDYEYNQ